MSNTISVQEPQVDTLLPTWTGLELERATSSEGTFSLVTAIPYVAGQTTYTYVDADGIAGSWYRTRRYGPAATYGSYSDAWPVTAIRTPVAEGARRSWLHIRRILARALQSLTVATTTADGNADGTSIVARRLATATTASRYKHVWVMPTNGTVAGELARVKLEDALNLSTGELLVSPPFSAQVLDGTTVEIHRLLPPEDDDGWPGLRECANNALRELWVADRVSISGVTGQPSYSLATYEEWLDPAGVLELRQQAVDSTMNMYPSGTFDAVRDAGDLTVQVAPPLPGGETHGLEIFRPLDTYIKTGGVWGNSTSGFVNDSDECLAIPDLVVTVALVHAYEAIASGPDGGRYEDLVRRQRLKANIAKQIHLDHRQRRPSSSLAMLSGGWDPKSFETWSRW